MNKRRILQRLHGYQAEDQTQLCKIEVDSQSQIELENQFIKNLQAVKGQVICCNQGNLQDMLTQVLADNSVQRLCAGIQPALNGLLDDLPQKIQVTRLDQPFEAFKHNLFTEIDAGLTTCNGALAETGSIILYSDPLQPRSVSLVPSIHIVVLFSSQIFTNLSTWLEQSDLIPLPTNLLLITGPSKSADIEQVLAYGVHGPKQLIVLLIE